MSEDNVKNDRGKEREAGKVKRGDKNEDENTKQGMSEDSVTDCRGRKGKQGR